ncbi:MAG: FIST signal transduction protein, partial [Planctomycetota bacterium]
HPWRITPEDPLDDLEDRTICRRLGIADDHRVTIMLADPFTTPIQQLLPAVGRAGGPDRTVPIIGGLASGASQPGHNALALDEEVSAAGAYGVTLSGRLTVDSIVSQGCRPVGKSVVITKLKGNLVAELGGQPPMAVLKEAAVEMDERDRALLNRGLLLGVVIDEYKDHFGRGDFLVRNVTGLDPKRGVITVADDGLRVGQTVQFHVRDAATASEDLQLLLDAQELAAPPFAALLFTCNGRGTRLFAEPNHDLDILRGRLGEVPIAGFFAAGEIGPIGERSFLHGHTASIALLRE